MSDLHPKDGEIVVVRYPPSKRRRKFCGACGTWTWEVGGFGSGQFRHGRGGCR